MKTLRYSSPKPGSFIEDLKGRFIGCLITHDHFEELHIFSHAEMFSPADRCAIFVYKAYVRPLGRDEYLYSGEYKSHITQDQYVNELGQPVEVLDAFSPRSLKPGYSQGYKKDGVLKGLEAQPEEGDQVVYLDSKRTEVSQGDAHTGGDLKQGYSTEFDFFADAFYAYFAPFFFNVMSQKLNQ